MSSCQTSDINNHQRITETLQTEKNKCNKAVHDEHNCINKSNNYNIDSNSNNCIDVNCHEQELKIDDIYNSYLNLESHGEEKSEQAHRAEYENCSSSNGVSSSSNDTNHIMDEQHSNKSFELTCAKDIESEEQGMNDKSNQVHNVTTYVANITDKTDNSNLCKEKCGTLYLDKGNRNTNTTSNGDINENNKCYNKEVNCNFLSSPHETNAKIEVNQCTNYDHLEKNNLNLQIKSIFNNDSDGKNNNNEVAICNRTEAQAEKQDCTIANTRINGNNNSVVNNNNNTLNTHMSLQSAMCDTRSKHRPTKNARSSYPIRAPFYSIPLPTCHGSVITLYSLSQLYELIDTQAFLPSRTSIDSHSTELLCANKATCNNFHKAKLHEEPEELHTTLHAGETVVLLLHEGNAVLSNVLNSSTRELAQVRIYTLNLEGLPPQDYYEALSLNSNTTTVEETSHKRARIDHNEFTSYYYHNVNNNKKEEKLEELEYIEHHSTFHKDVNKANEHPKESYNNFNKSDIGSSKNDNINNTKIYSTREINERKRNSKLLEEEHDEEEELEEEEEEEEMTLITPHKHLSSQSTSMHNSPSLLSPPNTSCEMPSVTSHAVNAKTTATDIPEQISHVRSMVEITKRAPIKFAKQENSSPLASAIVLVKEHMVKIINTKLGIELEMELPFAHSLNPSPERPVSSSELVLGASLDTFDSYHEYDTINNKQNDAINVNDNMKGSNLSTYTSNHMTSNSYLDTLHNLVEPHEPNEKSSIKNKGEHTSKREHIKEKKGSQIKHSRKEEDIKVYKERHVLETKLLHSNNRENDYNGEDNENISFKSCAMIIWRAPCAPPEEYSPEPPLIKGEVVPALTPASQSHVKDKHMEHFMPSNAGVNSKEVGAKGTNLPFQASTHHNKIEERGSSYNDEAVYHDETSCSINDTREWFRKHVSCDGDALIVEYVRHVDQVHSLAMWQLVYTPIHLLRTVACALHNKQLCNLLEDVSLSSLEESFTLLYLGASWCPPCMRFVQTMPELIHDPAMKNVHVTIKADFDLAQAIYKCFDVSVIPTFIIFNNRRLVEAWRELHSALQTTSWNEECEVLCEELLRKAEIGRLQNSQLSTIITFIEKHCTVLTFDDDF